MTTIRLMSCFVTFLMLAANLVFIGTARAEETSDIHVETYLPIAKDWPAGARAAGAPALTAVQQIDMPLANEIAFDGNRVYVSDYRGDPGVGVHAFEIDRRGRLRETSMLPCDGLTDAAPLTGGRVAIGLQWDGSGCNVREPSRRTSVPGGVQIGHLGNDGRAHMLGSVAIPGGVHTLTTYPGRDLVYTSLGGDGAESTIGAVEGGAIGKTHIVDASRRDPKVVATFSSLLNPGGCHDILFERMDGRVVGFCPGLGGTEIWDASDPLAPKPIGRLHLPAGQLPHRVAISSDGQVAAVSDEAWVAHACAGGAPFGAIWFYDISDLEGPELLGYYGPQRGYLPAGTMYGAYIPCTAHNFNFIPDSRRVVVSWISGGTNVIDISDPRAIKEIAHYRPSGAAAVSAYWYRGRVYVADFERGVEVLRLDGSL